MPFVKTAPTYAEKMRQANREAKATVVALVLTVVVWIALGFGVATTGIEVFHTPLWIITGTVGTWLFAIAVAVFMSKCVIADVDLDDHECDGSQAPVTFEKLDGEPGAGHIHDGEPGAGHTQAGDAHE